MNWKFFIASCILAAGLLLNLGAPVIPVALGLCLAALLILIWRRPHRPFSGSRKP